VRHRAEPFSHLQISDTILEILLDFPSPINFTAQLGL
jgi:hypothetical protein